MASGIPRSTVISNADSWFRESVPYSQTTFKDGYRTDCSGYVSMAWELGKNYNTNTLLEISTSIGKGDLQAGDILLKSGSHVTIFEAWANDDKTKYWGYELVGGKVNTTKRWQIPYPYWKIDPGYEPRRYENIEN